MGYRALLKSVFRFTAPQTFLIFLFVSAYISYTNFILRIHVY